MNGSCSAYPSCLYTIQATRFSFKKITGNIFRSTAFQLSKYAPCIFDPANNQLHKKNKEIPFNHHQSIQSISCTRVSIILSKSCYNLQKKIYKSKFFKGNSSWNYFQRYATFISERTIRGKIVIIFIASLFVHEGLFLADNEIHSSMRRSTPVHRYSKALNVRFDASSLHKSPGERIERASCPRTWWNIERVTSFDLAPTRSILDFSDTRAGRERG